MPGDTTRAAASRGSASRLATRPSAERKARAADPDQQHRSRLGFLHEIAALYRIGDTLTEPRPRPIGIVDDVLVTGAHFKAKKMVLGARFPGVSRVGLAIARQVFASPFDRVDVDTVRQQDDALTDGLPVRVAPASLDLVAEVLAEIDGEPLRS